MAVRKPSPPKRTGASTVKQERHSDSPPTRPTSTSAVDKIGEDDDDDSDDDEDNNKEDSSRGLSAMMADGLNDARAIRVAELMTDFRNTQYWLSALQAQPSAEDYYLEGYTVLRNSVTEAQQVLAADFAVERHPRGNKDKEKAQLQAVIQDAAIRRFQCQRSYLRATAGQRWVVTRYTLLQSGQASIPQLQAVDYQLQTELAAITDEQVEYSLRAADTAAGKWTVDDPSLSKIQSELRRRRS